MLLMQKVMLTVILMLTLVNCQPQKPAEPDRAISRHRRRLAAYNVNNDDGDDDIGGGARWLLMAASAVAVTSLMTMFALCTCCPQYSKRRYR